MLSDPGVLVKVNIFGIPQFLSPSILWQPAGWFSGLAIRATPKHHFSPPMNQIYLHCLPTLPPLQNLHHIFIWQNAIEILASSTPSTANLVLCAILVLHGCHRDPFVVFIAVPYSTTLYHLLSSFTKHQIQDLSRFISRFVDHFTFYNIL